MPGTVSNTNVEPMWVVFGDTLLGLCSENDITVNVDATWADISHHQSGASLTESIHAGTRITVQVELAEYLDKDRFLDAFGFGETQIDDATPPNKRFAFTKLAASTNGNYVGTRATSIAKELNLRPVRLYAAAATETIDDLSFPKAFSRGASDILFSIQNATVIPITFEVLFDPSDTAGANLGVVGLLNDGTGSWAQLAG